MTFNGFEIINFNDVIGNLEESEILRDISSFRSKQNDDVENFLKNNAYSFCKLRQGITYLIYDAEKRLAGYFTLALKVMEFPLNSVSRTMLKVLERVGQKSDRTVTVPGILLAQWSKNFAFANAIRGEEMLLVVKFILQQVQYLVGGSFVFVECEAEKNRLVLHYEDMGFVAVGGRISTSGKALVQLIKKI